MRKRYIVIILIVLGCVFFGYLLHANTQKTTVKKAHHIDKKLAVVALTPTHVEVHKISKPVHPAVSQHAMPTQKTPAKLEAKPVAKVHAKPEVVVAKAAAKKSPETSPFSQEQVKWHQKKTSTKVIVKPQVKEPHNVQITLSDLYIKPYVNVNVGASAYYISNPEFGVGSKGTSTKPLMKTTNYQFTPAYHVGVGVPFYNSEKSFLTKVFGNNNEVEIRADYYDVSQTKNGGYTRGELYYITGGYILPAVNVDYINSSRLSAKRRNINAGLYFKGNKKVSSRVKMNPYAGVVYSRFDDDYDFSAVYETPTLDTDVEKFETKTNYYGLAAGDRVDLIATPQFSGFADLQVQALYSQSRLNADQDASLNDTVTASYIKRLAKSYYTVTYRAILALGASYKFVNKPNSVALDLKGGVDQWGNVPKVTTPNKEGSPDTHLARNMMINGFVSLNVFVPLG
jgi:hypothetical protein